MFNFGVDTEETLICIDVIRSRDLWLGAHDCCTEPRVIDEVIEPYSGDIILATEIYSRGWRLNSVWWLCSSATSLNRKVFIYVSFCHKVVQLCVVSGNSR